MPRKAEQARVYPSLTMEGQRRHMSPEGKESWEEVQARLPTPAGQAIGESIRHTAHLHAEHAGKASLPKTRTSAMKHALAEQRTAGYLTGVSHTLSAIFGFDQAGTFFRVARHPHEQEDADEVD